LAGRGLLQGTHLLLAEDAQAVRYCPTKHRSVLHRAHAPALS
jgi:hypothetical protein